MIELQKPYEDNHGITHAAAVIVIRSASSNSNQNYTLNATIGVDGNVSYNNAQPTSYTQVSFQAYLYPSLQALQTGKQPLVFRAADNTEHFHFQPQELISDTELVAYCEQYLLTNVINKQQEPLPEGE